MSWALGEGYRRRVSERRLFLSLLFPTGTSNTSPNSRATGVAALLGFEEIRERSLWLKDESGIRSLRYSYHRRGRKERRIEVIFDWSKGRVSNHVNGDTWHMAVPDRTFDKQNHLLALMRDLAFGRRSVSYRVADGGELKTYVFRYLGKQSVETEFGDFDTVVMERTRRPVKRRTVFWLAPSLDFLPVQIKHREGDTSITMHIRAASGFAMELSAANCDDRLNPPRFDNKGVGAIGVVDIPGAMVGIEGLDRKNPSGSADVT